MPESDDARPAVLLNQTDPPSSPLHATKQAQLDASSRLCPLPEQVKPMVLGRDLQNMA